MGKDNEMDEAVEQLTNLLKADSDDSDTLIKANGGDSEEDEYDDEDEDEYDEKYMKRNMKRFMKDNKSTMMKYMKNMGSVKKAIDHDMDEISDELDSAEAVLVQGTDILKAAQEQSENFVGVLQAMIPEQVHQGKLIKALSSVVLEMAEQINKIGSTPQPRKSVLNAGETNLNKAQDQESGKGASLQKAADFMQTNGFGGIKRLVMKAMNKNDQRAFDAITRIESCHGNLALLPQATQNYVAELIAAEGNGG